MLVFHDIFRFSLFQLNNRCLLCAWSKFYNIVLTVSLKKMILIVGSIFALTHDLWVLTMCPIYPSFIQA